MHPVGQLCLRRRGEHHLAVHARRQTTGVALGHPPHAEQRVGARPEHQLLQAADPCEVPRLRRREDPLPQPPYVILHPPPINWHASQRARPLVRSPRPWSRRPTCPSVPGSWSSSSPQAHLTASARFRARAPGPVSVAPMSRGGRYLRAFEQYLLSLAEHSREVWVRLVGRGEAAVDWRIEVKLLVSGSSTTLLRGGQGVTCHTSNQEEVTRAVGCVSTTLETRHHCEFPRREGTTFTAPPRRGRCAWVSSRDLGGLRAVSPPPANSL